MLFALLACATEPAPPTEAELERRRQVIRQYTRDLVEDLGDAGRYDCCVKTPCNLCATRMGGCKCGESLRRGEPVCEECALLWQQGQGDEEGVDPASVRSYLEAAREARARAKGGSCACGGQAGGWRPEAGG